MYDDDLAELQRNQQCNEDPSQSSIIVIIIIIDPSPPRQQPLSGDFSYDHDDNDG
jgi:hypothetical protein